MRRRLVTTEDIRRIALALPRTTEHLIHDRVKFRVGRLVYVSLSRDETVMGFAYPKDERDALVASDPSKFLPPEPVDVRYHWVRVRLAALDAEELRELVVDAWRMVVPKGVARDYESSQRSPARPALPPPTPTTTSPSR